MLIINVLSLSFKYVIPSIGDLTTRIIALLKGLPFQELAKDLLLEYLDDLELASSLQFEAFHFVELPRMREDSVTLL